MLNPTKILRGLEYIFWAITIIALSYAGYFFLSEMKNFKVKFPPVRPKTVQTDSLVNKNIFSQDLKPFGYYEKQIESRDIFSTLPNSSGSSAVKPQIVSGQLPSNLKVVGILLGDQPQVIIEDNVLRTSYFVGRKSVEAGMKIERVENNTVYLNYNGEIIGVDLKGSQINLQQTKF